MTTGTVTHTPPQAVTPGPCSCECAGCDAGYGHCCKAERGCGWRK